MTVLLSHFRFFLEATNNLSLMKKSGFLIAIFTLLFWVNINSLKAQSSFSFPDTLFVFNKTTDFGVLHWYLEIINEANLDTTLRWKAHFNQTLPKNWDISFDDQTTFQGKVNHLDSADFNLYSNQEFPQKLVIGNKHNNVASSNDTVRFDIYYPSEPSNVKSIYFVFNITSGGFLNITSSNKTKPAIYPNPCSSTLFLKNFKTNESIDILNASGKVVRTFSLLHNINSVQVDNLDPGLYFLRQGSLLLPFVKQ
jgi:hypothetical protein